MKVEKGAVQSRKATVWTREKISQLIELYRKHECLWNHWNHEAYKSKEKRNRAIEEICTTLRITKFDFGKKIHNLRNQFNSEMKKLEQRIGEAGGNVGDLNAGQRCKWGHFESLIFLRNVIEPRPGGYQTSFSGPKKMRLKFDYNNADEEINTATAGNIGNTNSTTIGHEEVTEYQFEEATAEDEETLEEAVTTDEFHRYEDDGDVPSAEREEIFDQKYQPPSSSATNQATTNQEQFTVVATLASSSPTTTKTYLQRIPQKATPQLTQQPQQQEVIHLEEGQTPSLATGAVIELSTTAITATTSTSTVSTSTVHNPPKLSSANMNAEEQLMTPTRLQRAARDQWDAFGELIASEFRHLNSDFSRKKLKRKIMQAMLEVGEDDDNLAANTATS